MSKKTYASKSEGKAKKIISIVCLILAAVFVIGVVAWSEIYNSGFVQRHTVAAKTENFSVSSTMMNYYTTSSYQSLISGDYATYLTYMGLDTSVALDQQEYQAGTTWAQYFKDYAKEEVRRMLILCEAAKAAGKSLTDEDYTEIDAAMQSLDTYATAYGYSSTDAFLKANYGANAKDIRKCMEYSALAEKYGEEVYDSFSYEDKDFDNYYSENKDSFHMVDYLMYTIKAEDKKVDDLKDDAKEEDKKEETKEDETAEAETEKKEEATVDPDSDDKKEDKEETKKDYSHLKAYADKMKNAKSKEEFEKAVRTYLSEYLYEGMSEEALEKDKIDFDEIIADCKTEGFTKPSSETELSKWLFADATTPYATRNEYDEEKGTFTVYMILPAQYDEKLDDCQYREDYLTADYYYILVSSEDEGSMEKAKTTADEIVKEYNEDATEDHFKKLEGSDAYGSGNGKIEGGVKNALGENVDAWLFASDRKAGDVASIEGEDGYYIVYFAGNNETKWKIDAENYLREADYTEVYHGFYDAYPVTFMVKGMNFVKITSN